jgi:hypothetical protein
MDLESEIIVYRNLLDSSEIRDRQVIVRPFLPIESTTTSRSVVKTNNKGSISISECRIENAV